MIGACSAYNVTCAMGFGQSLEIAGRCVYTCGSDLIFGKLPWALLSVFVAYLLVKYAIGIERPLEGPEE